MSDGEVVELFAPSGLSEQYAAHDDPGVTRRPLDEATKSIRTTALVVKDRNPMIVRPLCGVRRNWLKTVANSGFQNKYNIVEKIGRRYEQKRRKKRRGRGGGGGLNDAKTES